MFLFYFIAIIFIILICMVIKMTLLELGIKLFTGTSKDNTYLAIPSFICVLIEVAIVFVTVLILKHFNLDIISIMYEKFMKFGYNRKDLLINILSYVFDIVVIIFIQAFVLSLTYNKKIHNFLDRKNIKTDLTNSNVSDEIEVEIPVDIQSDLDVTSHKKSDEVYDVEFVDIDENEEFKKIFTFSNRVFSSIFEFVILFFFLLFFFMLGFFLGPKLFL